MFRGHCSSNPAAAIRRKMREQLPAKQLPIGAEQLQEATRRPSAVRWVRWRSPVAVWP